MYSFVCVLVQVMHSALQSSNNRVTPNVLQSQPPSPSGQDNQSLHYDSNGDDECIETSLPAEYNDDGSLVEDVGADTVGSTTENKKHVIRSKFRAVLFAWALLGDQKRVAATLIVQFLTEFQVRVCV